MPGVAWAITNEPHYWTFLMAGAKTPYTDFREGEHGDLYELTNRTFISIGHSGMYIQSL